MWATVYHGVKLSIPRRERIVSLLFASTFFVYTTLDWQWQGAKIDFSPARLFAPVRVDQTTVLTLLAGFLLPFLGYVAVWLFSDARQLLERTGKDAD